MTVAEKVSARLRTATDPVDRRRVWITWETQRRNRTVSQALGCQLFEFDLRHPPLVRYPLALAMTFWTLVRERPSSVFVQNPSIVLSTLAVAYGRLLRIPVIVDAHNAAIEPLRRPSWSRWVARLILRWASLTIVSNARLADTVRRMADVSEVAVLPDPVPALAKPRRLPTLRGRRNVLFICSWFLDEPYLEVIEAARLLPPDTYVYITGNSRGRLDGHELPSNVILTGYVDEETYLGLLYSCDVIVDLTTWEDCLVCGAYEAVAAERALVISGTQALKSFFDRGVLYTDNSHADLARQIITAFSGQDVLKGEVTALKQELLGRWWAHQHALELVLSRVTREDEEALDRT